MTDAELERNKYLRMRQRWDAAVEKLQAREGAIAARDTVLFQARTALQSIRSRPATTAVYELCDQTISAIDRVLDPASKR